MENILDGIKPQVNITWGKARHGKATQKSRTIPIQQNREKEKVKESINDNLI